jgi:1-acyl-sn-glycerol-3-phosphate acyltransferase
MRLFDDRNQTLSRIAQSGATHDGRARTWHSSVHAVLRFFRSAYELSVFYTTWLVFGLVSAVIGAFMAAAGVVLPAHLGRQLGQWMISGWFRLFLGYLRVTGLVKLDLTALDQIKHDRQLILAPNHPSMLDAVLVISRLPRVTCIMKAKLWDNAALGGGSRLAGYVRNDSNAHMVRAAVESLAAGGQLLLFPEGTRSVEHPVNPFKGAVSLIAKKSHAEVQTIFIESNTAFLGKHWPTLKRPNFPLRYSVRLGRRFAAPTSHDDSKLFAHELETYFRQELDQRSR